MRRVREGLLPDSKFSRFSFPCISIECVERACEDWSRLAASCVEPVSDKVVKAEPTNRDHYANSVSHLRHDELNPLKPGARRAKDSRIDQ